MRWDVRRIDSLEPAVTWVVTASCRTGVSSGPMKFTGPPPLAMRGIHEEGHENRKGAVLRT